MASRDSGRRLFANPVLLTLSLVLVNVVFALPSFAYKKIPPGQSLLVMNRPHSDVNKFKERLKKHGLVIVNEVRCNADQFSVFEVQPQAGTIKSALVKVQTSGDTDLEAVEVKFASGFQQCLPDDPSFGVQTDLQKLKFSEMRCLLIDKGISQVVQPRFTLIDTGSTIVSNGSEMTDVQQFNFFSGANGDPETPFEPTGPNSYGVHGTGVSSIACTATNNALFMSGIASHTNKTVKITCCRVTNDGDTCETVDVIRAMTWCIDHQAIRGGPGVINMSVNARNPAIPSYNSSPVFQGIAKSGLKFKDLFVNSAGNEHLEDPSKEKSIRRVAGVDSTDQLWVDASDPNHVIGSNYGKFIKAAALSVGVAAYDRSTTSVQFATGTSFAAPQWAGAIALLMSLDPKIDAIKADKIIEKTGRKTSQKLVIPDLRAAVIKALKIKP